jgi:hypothetical protein
MIITRCTGFAQKRLNEKDHRPEFILYYRQTNYLTKAAHTFDHSSVMLAEIVLIEPILYRRHQPRSLLHQHQP